MANDASDVSTMGNRKRLETLLQFRIADTQNRKLTAACN